jgi:hypothetical protein
MGVQNSPDCKYSTTFLVLILAGSDRDHFHSIATWCISETTGLCFEPKPHIAKGGTTVEVHNALSIFIFERKYLWARYILKLRPYKCNVLFQT